MNINKSNFSGHNFESFFVKIFGAIENILSAGQMMTVQLNIFCNFGKNWKFFIVVTLMDNHSGQFSVYTDIISVHLFHYKIEICFYYLK